MYTNIDNLFLIVFMLLEYNFRLLINWNTCNCFAEHVTEHILLCSYCIYRILTIKCWNFE